MKRSTSYLAFAFCCLVALALLARSAIAGPTTPMEAQPDVSIQPIAPEAVSSPSSVVFSYQGQLTDAAGVPITNAGLPMTLKLYSVLTGGSSCWTESHTGANAVSVQGGLFHVLLGQLTADQRGVCSGGADGTRRRRDLGQNSR